MYIYTYAYIYTNIYIYICIYTSICMYVNEMSAPNMRHGGPKDHPMSTKQSLLG